MISVRSLAGITQDQLFRAWQEAFDGYVRSWTAEELSFDLIRRGYDPLFSYGAFDGDRLVSFSLNGTGMYGNKYSAYDAGTGTVPGYRGRGLQSRILETLIPVMSDAGIRQYILEVLQDNNRAYRLYNKWGFEVSREFNYFIQATTHTGIRYGDAALSLRKLDSINRDEMSSFCDFLPSWQNSFESVDRSLGVCLMLGAFIGEEFAGYGILDVVTGALLQLAVKPTLRRRGVASRILAELIVSNRAPQIRVINSETTCAAMTSFFVNHNIPLVGRQFEMIKQIR